MALASLGLIVAGPAVSQSELAQSELAQSELAESEPAESEPAEPGQIQPRQSDAAGSARGAMDGRTVETTNDARTEDDAQTMLEEVMSRDEIYLNLVARPPLKPYTPKTFIPGAPYTLPFDATALAETPRARMKDLVPASLVPHFDLYLYVNKAREGLWAQQMFIFEKPAGLTGDKGDTDGRGGGDGLSASAVMDRLRLTDRWLASTGRERRERYFTTTPVGLFRLDRERFYPFIRSVQWDGAAMYSAMFFDYHYRSRPSGYAIHAVSRRLERFLGRRASGGCIRLNRELAKTLFGRIQSRHAGMVPEFDRDPRNGYTSKAGVILRDEEGQPLMKPGYRVLIVLDDLEKDITL